MYTDTNLPLSGRPGLESVFDGSVSGRLYLEPVAGGDMVAFVCQQSTAAAIVQAPPTDAPPTPTTAGAQAMTHVSSVIVFSLCLLSIVASVLSW